MNDNLESYQKAAGMGRDDHGYSEERPSHFGTNTKRNFVEEIGFQQPEAHFQRPEDIRRLREKNQNLMRNLAERDGSNQQIQSYNKKRFRTSAVMLGRVPDANASKKGILSRKNGGVDSEQSDPKNVAEISDRSSEQPARQGVVAVEAMPGQKSLKTAENYIQKTMNRDDCDNASRLNQSVVVSEKNRYSKYLEEGDVEDSVMDASYQRQVDRVPQGGDDLDDMDDCEYSLGSDPRSARKVSDVNLVAEEPEAVAAADSNNDSNNDIKKSSQVESVDKSGLSRQSHYTSGQNSAVLPFEGGSRRGGSRRGGGESNNDQSREEGRDAAGQKAMNLFRHNDPLNQNNVNDVGQEMRERGSKEKTGYMEKEAEFSKQLKNIQTYHIEICENLMKMAIFVLLLEWAFSIFCIITFGCAFGDCENQLVCFVHYIKFAQTLFVMSNFKTNITEGQPNHPIAMLNTFFVITLYYVCLYRYMDELKESINLVHFCVVYPSVDFILILISFYAIWKVKQKSKALISNKKFKEYNQEADQALQDILYLPQEFESDDGEEDF